MPRFVILEHDHPELHWDFMLEWGPALKTWRLARPPENAGEIIDALPIGDHRLAYLDYEGPVSGERGSVMQWDKGNYELFEEVPETMLQVRLSGARVTGVARLENRPCGWTFCLEVNSPSAPGLA